MITLLNNNFAENNSYAGAGFAQTCSGYLVGKSRLGVGACKGRDMRQTLLLFSTRLELEIARGYKSDSE